MGLFRLLSVDSTDLAVKFFNSPSMLEDASLPVGPCGSRMPHSLLDCVLASPPPPLRLSRAFEAVPTADPSEALLPSILSSGQLTVGSLVT